MINRKLEACSLSETGELYRFSVVYCKRFLDDYCVTIDQLQLSSLV